MLFFIALVLFFIPSFTVFSQEPSPSPDPRRTDMGYEVSQNNYLNIPSDMKVQKVANNVITAESDTDYLARKLQEQNEVLAQIQAQMALVDARVKVLEEKDSTVLPSPAASPSLSLSPSPLPSLSPSPA